MPDQPFRGVRSRAAALAACALVATLVAAGATPAYAADDIERPTAPGPITVVSIDTTSVELTWAASTDNVGVVRYPVGARFEDTGAQYSTDTTSIRITGLRPSRTYTFSVWALDAAGNSSLANPTLRLTMPPGDDQPPGAPGQPVAYDVSATQVWLRWAHSVENVALDRYEVFRVDAGGALTLVRDVSQYPPRNSAQIGGLTPNTPYTFVVRARDEVGHLSPLSAPVTVTTLPPPPSCAVRSVVRQWSDGFVAHLVVTNTGTTAVDGWTMTWRFWASQQVQGIWGAKVVDRVNNSYLRVANTSRNAVIPPGGSVSLGLVATGTQLPEEITLNGGLCTVADE
ncbi:fibronectin type III domain-containing protein [Micromonospora sp. LAH09]|uniref:fibronectin type III domain-containing protein n=1 Tax=Micromonospora cabrerizensis TaxID=2911213 RepID=UPI001EE8E2BE|nr:fibronectin type III domain-containing protein [Micromonospora cabrerizensis]MCG5470261.1 fibronectin type III domain-containing protein [Micromonospora cabrerizensis]